MCKIYEVYEDYGPDMDGHRFRQHFQTEMGAQSKEDWLKRNEEYRPTERGVREVDTEFLKFSVNHWVPWALPLMHKKFKTGDQIEDWFYPKATQLDFVDKEEDHNLVEVLRELREKYGFHKVMVATQTFAQKDGRRFGRHYREVAWIFLITGEKVTHRVKLSYEYGKNWSGPSRHNYKVEIASQ